MRRRRTPTLGKALTLGVVRPLVFVAALGAGMTLAPTTAAEIPERPDPVATLVEAHDCWTGDAPADVEIPGHVIVTEGGFTYRAGADGVGRALAQIFDGVDHGLDVHAFCR